MQRCHTLCRGKKKAEGKWWLGVCGVVNSVVLRATSRVKTLTPTYVHHQCQEHWCCCCCVCTSQCAGAAAALCRAMFCHDYTAGAAGMLWPPMLVLAEVTTFAVGALPEAYVLFEQHLRM